MTRVLLFVALMLATPMIYGGAYLWMVTGIRFDIGEFNDIENFRPFYRFENPATRAIFAPAFAIDKQLRPAEWEFDPQFCRTPE